jgi:hypothetical protein
MLQHHRPSAARLGYKGKRKTVELLSNVGDGRDQGLPGSVLN